MNILPTEYYSPRITYLEESFEKNGILNYNLEIISCTNTSILLISSSRAMVQIPGQDR